MTVKTKFIIKGFEDYGSIGVCEISDEAISHALRTSTSRRKLSIENLDTTLQNAQPRVCAFCSRKFKRFTYNHQVLSVDKFKKRRNAYVVYPGTLMRSDFYFPMIDVHVEIAGSWHISGYSERMQLKQDLFSCWIVKNTKEYDTIISKLEKAHAERSRLTDFATGID